MIGSKKYQICSCYPTVETESHKCRFMNGRISLTRAAQSVPLTIRDSPCATAFGGVGCILVRSAETVAESPREARAESGGGVPGGGGGRQYRPSAERMAPGIGAHFNGTEGDEAAGRDGIILDVTGKMGTVGRDPLQEKKRGRAWLLDEEGARDRA